ncbi:MAG: RCC1 domain-containing protein [Capsulimonadaceae bacterium]
MRLSSTSTACRWHGRVVLHAIGMTTAALAVSLGLAATPAHASLFVAHVYSWGDNSWGELGNGITTGSSLPVWDNCQPYAIFSPTAVAAGDDDSLALGPGYPIATWGEGNYGELGDGFYWTGPDTQPGFISVGGTAVSAGQYHCLSLTSSGTVLAWGNNTYGQLGTGNTTSYDTPVEVNGLTGVIAVAAGYDHSLALLQNGTVWAWGYNSTGELGNGSTTTSYIPVQVTGLSGVTAISAGSGFSLALCSNGTVWGWGSNFWGQLGLGTAGTWDTAPHTTPAQVPGLPTITAISAGGNHSLAIDSSGNVWAWGFNMFGQLGNGTTDETNNPCPAPVEGLTNVVGIAGGGVHSLAVRVDGTAWAWGCNSSGQLGNGTTTNSCVPVEVEDPTGNTYLTKVSAVAAGASHSIAIVPPVSPYGVGIVSSWGDNSYGELGNGTTTGSTVPVSLANLPPLISMSAIAAGGDHSLIIPAEYPMATFGEGNYGELGDGQSPTGPTPSLTYVTPPSGPYEGMLMPSGMTAVSDGQYHCLALSATGTVSAWGDNNYGQLGNGGTSSSAIPVAVNGLSGVVAIAAGYYHSLALLQNGTVWAWGYNSNGELGSGTTSYSYSSTPVQVVDPTDPTGYLTGITAIAAGGDFSLALRSDGCVVGWGSNFWGQLGYGSGGFDTANHPTPVPVQDLTNVTTISAGGNHSLAIDANGNVWAWGFNMFGQLGNGTTDETGNPIPVPVTGFNEPITGIAAGGVHSLAVGPYGYVWAWGSNSSGQLGNGTTNNSSVPVQIPTIGEAVAVAAGANHSLALMYVP